MDCGAVPGKAAGNAKIVFPGKCAPNFFHPKVNEQAHCLFIQK